MKRLLILLLFCASSIMAQDMRPSAYLGRPGTVTIRGGKILGSSGGVTVIGQQDVTATVNATTYIYVDLSGTPAIATSNSSFPAGSFFPICIVTADINGIITSFTDSRPDFFMAGGNGASSPVATPTPFVFNTDMRFKGPNPYVDLTAYGARAVVSAPTTTASCTNGSPTIILSSAIALVNGDGIVIYGCGGANGMATPSAPTVTPSIARVMTGTRDVVNSSTAATTYNYCVAWRDLKGGMTACSPTGTTTTGLAAIGSISKALTSLTRANDVITAVTSSAHDLPVGCSGSGATGCPMVYVVPTTAANADASWLGWFHVETVADNTHFTYKSGQDTRNGSITAPTASFTGNVFYFLSNHQSFGAAPTNGFQPYIYTAGGALIGPAWPTNPSAASFTDLAFDDFGATMMGTTSLPIPGYVPTTAPASATNDALVTTIVSGGGTTTLTVANTASNTISGQTIIQDNCPNIINAMNATYASSFGPPLYFPFAASGSYFINSLCDLRSQNPTIIFGSTVVMNDTLLIGRGNLSGKMLQGTGSVASFSFGSYPRITCTVAPCIYRTTAAANGLIEWLSIGSNNKQSVSILQDGGGASPGSTYKNLDVLASDLMSIPFLCRGIQTAPCQFTGDRLNVTSSQNTDGATATPAMLLGSVGQTGPVGTINLGSIMLSGHGILSYAGGWTIDWIYCQGCRTPLMQFSYGIAGNAGAYVKIKQATLDTTGQALVNYLQGAGTADVGVDIWNTNSGGSGPLLTGNRMDSGVHIANFSTNPGTLGQNRDSSYLAIINAADNIYNVNTLANYPLQLINAAISSGTSYPIFVADTSPAAPTCVVSAGGTFTVETGTFRVWPIWGNNGTGSISPPCSPYTTTGGNQTVTVSWSIPGNPKGVLTVHCNSDGITGCFVVRGATCNFPQVIGTSTVFSAPTAGCGFPAPIIGIVGTGGPTMMLPGVGGMTTTQINIGGGLVQPPAAGFTATRNLFLPDVPGIVPVTSYVNSSYDTFNRADGGFGANWTTITSLTAPAIVSNQAKGGGASFSGAVWNANIFSSTEQFVEVTAGGTGAAASAIYLMLRQSSTTQNSGYWCAFVPSASGGIYDNGVDQTAGSISYAAGDVLRCEVVTTAAGATVTQYKNGMAINTYNDTTPVTSGFVGLQFFANTAATICDNWSGGNLHPLGHLDVEQDFIQPQHFQQAITVGNPAPIAGALTAGIYTPQIIIAGGTALTTSNQSGTVSICMTTSCVMTTPNIGASTTASQMTSTLATGTAPFSITSTTPVANLTTVPTTYNHSGTQQTAAHIVIDSGTLSGGTLTVTFTGSAVFSSSSSYVCLSDDATALNPMDVTYTSGSQVVFNGTTTDAFRYICVGN